MGKYSSIPIYNSENGQQFYNELSRAIGKPEEMESVVVLSIVRLLTFLPGPIAHAIISPMGALPLMINDKDEQVKRIVKLRLQENV